MLDTIENHNRKVFEDMPLLRPTGISCPVCGTELVYRNDIVYLSKPPQKDVVCGRCGYSTRIFC